MRFDVVIIGAGPVGLAAAIEAKRQDLNYVILDKGVLCNSIYNFPVHMRFFTTADLLEIGDHPFPSTDVKPTRQKTLDYYRRVAELENLDIRQHHEVVDIVDDGVSGYVISGIERRKGKKTEFEFKSTNVVIATGYFDNPVGLGDIEGEDLDIANHYYTQPHGFYDHDVVIIGAGNSGAEAALELYRHGANVTLVHKYSEPKDTLKYWVGPDLKNRLEEGSIEGVMPAETKKIQKDGLIVDTPEETDKFIEADKIFILTGFTPNTKLLEKWGMNIQDDLSVELSDTFEVTNRSGMYVIGSACTGKKTNSVFIENGREHAKIAVQHIANHK